MKQKYVLTFPPAVVNEPVTYTLVKEFDFRINILKAEVRSGHEGYVLLDIEADEINIEKGLLWLGTRNVKAEPFIKQINFNLSSCIHCGACTAICFTGALSMNRLTWQVGFSSEDCIACGLCIRSCPLKLFSINL